jgi:ATP-dependent DNA helicase RecQ
MVRSCDHSSLSVYGLMKDLPKKTVQSLCYQLLDQGLLERIGGDRPIMRLTSDGVEVMKGKRQVRLVQPRQGPVKKTRAETESWEGIDMGLVEHLRAARKSIAQSRGVPAFVVFDDKSLRDLANKKPGTLPSLRRVTGFGEKRTADIGQEIVNAVIEYCAENNLPVGEKSIMDFSDDEEEDLPMPMRMHAVKSAAFKLFDERKTVAQVAAALSRAASTTRGYLVEYIQERKPQSVEAWVNSDTYGKIVGAAGETPQLRPIFEALGGGVTYDEISIVIAHLRAMSRE